ncbi:MAG: hypothetical protein QOI80_2601 [Solirubrobacteraceae bacterium]|nr:hypothetical protein [Solirubrobacteraceae bacterium]
MRALVLVLLVAGAMLPATAVANTNDTGPCVPASNAPTSDSDTQWSVRRCDVPDFDQRRVAASNLGQPNPITVDGLPGNGSCHCVLASIVDLYGRAQVPLDGAPTYATFDWNGRGAMPAPASGSTYDTSTYSDAEVEAYQDTTAVMNEFGSIADVSYGQDATHTGCGTSWGALYNNLPLVAAEFGEEADDYAFAGFGIDADSPADMARALAHGVGVGFAYGYYALDPANSTADVDAATARTGGHANAIVGVSRSGDTYTFETADPASSAEPAEDKNRQSQFARTIWTATERQLKVAGGAAAVRFKLEDTSRYVDSWISLTSPSLVVRLRPDKLLVRPYVPARDLPDPPIDKVSKYTFPGPIVDAVEDQVASRVLALVTVGRSRQLWVGDEFTGRTRQLDAALPAGAQNLAALPDGSTAILGAKVLRTFDGNGRQLASQKIAGGGADVALDPSTGGVVVLRADGKRLLRFGPGLAAAGGRRIHAPANARLSVSADGSVRTARRALATPTGGRLVLAGRRATVHADGQRVPGRRVNGLKGATLLDLSVGGVLHRPPGGAKLSDFVDAPLARPLRGYEEMAP